MCVVYACMCVVYACVCVVFACVCMLVGVGWECSNALSGGYHCSFCSKYLSLCLVSWASLSSGYIGAAWVGRDKSPGGGWLHNGRAFSERGNARLHSTMLLFKVSKDWALALDATDSCL